MPKQEKPEAERKNLEQRVRLDKHEVDFLESVRREWGLRYPADALRHCIRVCMRSSVKKQQSA